MNTIIPVYAAVIAAALAVASAVFTVTRQQQAATLKDRHQVYASIMGKKHLRNQLMVSRFEALIFSDYHERRWALANKPADSIDFQEAMRWMHKSEDLVLEIARTNQSLFENLGLARTAFAPSPELTELTNRLYRFRTPIIKPPLDQKNDQELEQWKTEAMKQVQALIESEYGSPLDALLTYLDQNMRTKL